MSKLNDRLYQAANEPVPVPSWARGLIIGGMVLLVFVASVACWLVMVGEIVEMGAK